MADDIRYSELKFLQFIQNSSDGLFNPFDESQRLAMGVGPRFYEDLAATLIEDLYLRLKNEDMQRLVSRLRGEHLQNFASSRIPQWAWDNPRDGLKQCLQGTFGGLQQLEITYRGLRRIEELRDFLRHDRILEPFGVLLSMQYFRRDLEDALKRPVGVEVSIIYADMDNFKRINTKYGQAGGDVVMKSYLEVVRDNLGLLGVAYRGVGDEVAAIIVGQGHKRTLELAEKIRRGVESMRCRHNAHELPLVTASIGVATTPPEQRLADIEVIAESRKRVAKDKGKNCVISSDTVRSKVRQL